MRWIMLSHYVIGNVSGHKTSHADDTVFPNSDLIPDYSASANISSFANMNRAGEIYIMRKRYKIFKDNIMA